MPMYCYHCPSCDRQVEDFRTIERRNEGAACPECGGPCPRDRMAENAAPVRLDYRTPIELYSAAPATQPEYEAMRRRNPGLKFNDQLVPVVHNRGEKLAFMRREGLVENT